MKNNQLIVDDRNTGKTTYLFEETKRLLNEGSNIFVLDSATEHEHKSLLKKICDVNKNTITIDVHDPNKIVINKIGINEFSKKFMNYFPFNEVIKNKDRTICFDLSFFLEKGHDVYEETQSIEKYKYYRQMYNNLSQQIIVCLILMEKFGIIHNSIVVMDEIEFPIVDYDVSLLQNNLSFLASVHPENAFGTFYTSFEKLNFVSYKNRKE